MTSDLPTESFFAAVNLFGILMLLGVARVLWHPGSARAEQPAPRNALVPSAPPCRGTAPPGVLVIGLIVVVALMTVLVPALSGLAIVVFQMLATVGERSATPGAMPFEQLLVPALNGLTRVCQWLLVPCVATLLFVGWRRTRVATPGKA